MRTPRHEPYFGFTFFASAVAAALLIWMVFAPRFARAQEYPCPLNAKSCKVITLTPEEEASLAGPEGLFDHAAWANRVRFGDAIWLWRDKLRNAPAGKAAAPPAPFPPPPPPPSQK